MLVPEQQWQEISVDFIGPLPLSQGFDIIVVFIDRLSKGVLLAACYLTITLEDFAKLFITVYYSLYRLLRAIVSDRGPQFIRQV